MWTYETSVIWKEEKLGEAHAGGKAGIELATSPEFGGPPNMWTPEDLLTTAVASCIMTSVLFYLERDGIEMRSYMSNASTQIEKRSAGLTIAGVDVEVAITPVQMADEAAIRKAVERAEKACPIARSLCCRVNLKLHINGVHTEDEEL